MNKLAKAMTEYFDSLSPEEIAEEVSLANSMREAAQKIDFERELVSGIPASSRNPAMTSEQY